MAVNLREKLLPEPGFESGSPALRAASQTNWTTQTNHWAKLESAWIWRPRFESQVSQLTGKIVNYIRIIFIYQNICHVFDEGLTWIGFDNLINIPSNAPTCYNIIIILGITYVCTTLTDKIYSINCINKNKSTEIRLWWDHSTNFLWQTKQIAISLF